MSAAKDTRKRLTLADVEALLDQDKGDTGWRCPAHDDASPSLTVNEGNKGIVIKCHAGCTFEEVCEALGIEPWQLFEGTREERNDNGGIKKPEQSLAFDGCTRAQYAQAKGLDLEMLKEWGLADTHTPSRYNGKPVVLIPYVDKGGEVLETRVRLSLKKGQTRFKWTRKNAKAPLYGLWMLNAFHQQHASIFLVEGESDCHTLWQPGMPALGIPGAGIWKEEWAASLEGFDSIYAVIEPDQGGPALKSHLLASSLKERVLFIHMSEDAKDVNELHRNARECGEDFDALLNELIDDAVSATEDANTEAAKEAVRQDTWPKCEALAKEPDILARFVEDLEQRGVVGEDRAAKLQYLVITTRVLEEPVSAITHGPSGSGKSWLTTNTQKFFPEEAFHIITTMSDGILARGTAPLQHKFLVFLEADGMSEKVALILRTLLSEGQVIADILVPSDDEGWIEKRFVREGPTGLLMTTTKLWVHNENETRVLKIPTNDSPEQTKQTMRASTRKYRPETRKKEKAVDLAPWHALHAWIEAGECLVDIPYADKLVSLIPPVAVRLRRDISALLRLISAHALLHHANRKRNAEGWVVATLDDYEAVRELVHDIMAEGVSLRVSAAVRETVAAVETLVGPRDKPRLTKGVTFDEIGEVLGCGPDAAKRRVDDAMSKGFLKDQRNLPAEKRQPARIVIGSPIPEDDKGWLLPPREEMM